VKGLFPRFLAIAMLAAAGWSATSGATDTRESEVFRLEPGDRIRVAGAEVGCRVKRMRQLEGRIVLDCRRGGRLQGTYGTLLTEREAILLRFLSSTTATRIATGTHRGKVERCR
jgi:hypothetical protein